MTGAKANSLIRTTNAGNKPDSLRLYYHRIQRCYTSSFLMECSPTTPPNTGIYFDNVSFCFIDAPAPPGMLPIVGEKVTSGRSTLQR